MTFTLTKYFEKKKEFTIRNKLTLVISRTSSQAPGAIGSVLGLVGPVSVYRDCCKSDLGLLCQCDDTYNCLSRSVPETHNVAGTLRKQPTNTKDSLQTPS